MYSTDHFEIDADSDRSASLDADIEDSGANITQVYFNEIRNKALLKGEEEKALARLARDGDLSARQKMIEHNLRLVVKMARRYVHANMTLLDLIEEGNLGLMHALDKFDPDRGFRFSTYATWWIRQSIERAIMNQSRTIRLPVHVVKKINAIRREMKSRGDGEDGFHMEHVADKLGIDVEEAWDALHQNEATLSLDAPLDIDPTLSIGEAIPDENGPGPDGRLEAAQMYEWVGMLIDRLNSKERAVLEMRYGFNDCEPMTLEQISHHLGVTRERIRQIQNEALMRIRKQCAESRMTCDMLM